MALEGRIAEHLRRLCTTYPDRHMGGPGNRDATGYFARCVAECGFAVDVTELDCLEWEGDDARLVVGDETYPLHVGPYSLPVEATGRLAAVSNVTDLENGEFAGDVLLLHGEIAREQLMPKNFAFYNPESHRRVVAALERQSPAAVLAATGRDPGLAGGAYPFPLIEDGDFDIPHAFLTDTDGERLLCHAGEQVSLLIRSRRIPALAQHVVARKGGVAPRVVFFAHIDSKDGTPGALDNASGAAVLLGLAELLADYNGALGIELVPLNGEDYYAATGQMRYLADNRDRFGDIVLGCNVDGAGFIGARPEVSLYGVSPSAEKAVREAMRASGIGEGPQWQQGDHGILTASGVPAIAVTSSDVFFNVATVSHTDRDTLAMVDPDAVARVSRFFADLVTRLAAGITGPPPTGVRSA